MKISLNWLRELVDLTGQDAGAVAAQLTQQGLEVEGIEPKGRESGGGADRRGAGDRPHPNAEKLRLVRVRAGSREEEVVCGAPNVPPPGNRVCWAAPGREAARREDRWRRARSAGCCLRACCAVSRRWSWAREGTES